jgi:hypothetical protein
MPVQTTIKLRRDTAANWTSTNPVLSLGEPGLETDTNKVKYGDGSTAWSSLGYAGISQADIDNAVANVIDLAPSALDTLNELAASIGDDADFANTVATNIANAVSNHNGLTANVHGISDTSALETTAGAQSKADTAQANAASYTDTSIANLVDSAPATLDTLNELAAALGDDANFATTVTASLSGKASSSHTHLIAEITDYVEPDAYPDQTGKSGMYLTTDGEAVEWAELDIPAGTLVSDTPPVGQADNTLWYESDSGRLHILYDAVWVEVAAGIVGPAGPTGATGATGGYSAQITVSASQPSGGSNGDIWFVY